VSLSGSGPVSSPASIFGKYDIRAILSPTFNASTYHQLGSAYARWLLQQPGVSPLCWVAVGQDVRLSSPECTLALIKGLNEQGINTVDLGMVPSPFTYFAECYSSDTPIHPEVTQPLVGSLMVTASHNPPEYNGLKMTFAQLPLLPDPIQAVRQLFEAPVAPLPPAQQGKKCEWTMLPTYQTWLQQTEGLFAKPLTIVVDCANAAMAPYAPKVLADLGMNVIPLYDTPDGRFPNHHPDPCVPENLALLQKAVLQHQADLGVSYDGDGDRLGIVDSTGRIIPGDMLTLLLFWGLMDERAAANASLSGQSEPVTIVSEVKCSRHLFDAIKAKGAKVTLSMTGHSFMKRTVRTAHALLAGELSGHIVFRDRHWGFDDALYNTVRLLKYILAYQQANPGQNFTNWCDTLPKTALSPERRVPCTPAQRDAVLERIKQEVTETHRFLDETVEAVETLDGVRVDLAEGFCLVRGSNTEPCLTLRSEAADESTLAKRDQALMAYVKAIIEKTAVAV
jgi:phosphomannomutase / phosphoglucomutase